MASRSIIKHLDTIKLFCSSGFTSVENVTAYVLLLETSEEGLDRRVIITIFMTTHAGEQAMGLAESIPFVTTGLRTLIRVNNDVMLGLTR